MTPEYLITVAAAVALLFVLRSTMQDVRKQRERDEMRKHLRRTSE